MRQCAGCDCRKYLAYNDLQMIAYYRWQAHKPKFKYFMVNMCDVMSEPRVINNILKMSQEVQGYKGMCVGISGLRLLDKAGAGALVPTSSITPRVNGASRVK